MITVSPAGLSTTALVANQVSVLIGIKEKINPFCINSTIQPQVSVVYINETPFLKDTSVFVPINAIITIVIPGLNGKATTHLYNERFIVAFQGQTAVPSSVTIASTGKTQGGSDIKCCKAYSYSIGDSLTITIA